MFKENDHIIYKRKVCKIVEIKKNLINGEDYYILIPIEDTSLKISVPISNRSGCLRPLINKAEIKSLIKRASSINIIESEAKNLEQEYKNLLTTDNHEDLIKIIKTTYLRNKERTNLKKKASDKDIFYFDQAEKYLYNELSIVLGLTYEEAKKYFVSEVLKLC